MSQRTSIIENVPGLLNKTLRQATLSEDRIDASAVVAKISLADDFSVYPGGRYLSDGPFSGEEFRNKIIPLFQINDAVVIDLDGVRGHPASFLEEAFGGLLRNGLTLEEVRSKLCLQTMNDNLYSEVWSYVYAEHERQHP